MEGVFQGPSPSGLRKEKELKDEVVAWPGRGEMWCLLLSWMIRWRKDSGEDTYFLRSLYKE